MSVLQQIAELEDDIAKVLEAAVKAVAPLEKQLASEVAKLGERRHALVSGKAQPEPAELEGWDDAEAKSLNSGGGGGAGAAPKGVPYFWASVLSNCDAVAQSVTGRDRLALEYLRDVRRLTGRGDGVRGVELVFDAKNPYFHNKTLRRAIGQGVDEGTHIDWKDAAHNLTVKEVSRKAKKPKKGKGKGAGGGDGGGDDAPVRTRLKPCPSFFRFFEVESAGAAAHLERGLVPEIEEAGEFEEGDEQDARAEAKRESDAELLAALAGPVVLRATHLYLEGPLQGGGRGSGGGASRGGGSSEDEDDYELVAGGGAGTVADLPPATRAVVAALGAVQRRMDEAVSRSRAARHTAADAATQKLRGLYAQRRALLAGEDAPRCFWLRALRSIDAAALAITPRDAAVLQHLVDVRYEVQQDSAGSASSGAGGGGGGGGEQQVQGLLELEFGETCPQLAGTRVLRKSYHFTVGVGASGAPALRLLSSKVLAAPQWAPGVRDPTHRKARDGRLRPCASFFQLFRAAGGGGKWAFNLTGPEKDVQSEANELEVELLEELQAATLPRAAAIYSAAPRGDDIAASDDEGASSEEEGAEEEEAGSDSEEAAARRAALRQRKEQAGARPWWRISRGGALILLLVLMLAGQYLALILHLTGG